MRRSSSNETIRPSTPTGPDNLTLRVQITYVADFRDKSPKGRWELRFSKETDLKDSARRAMENILFSVFVKDVLQDEENRMFSLTGQAREFLQQMYFNKSSRDISLTVADKFTYLTTLSKSPQWISLSDALKMSLRSEIFLRKLNSEFLSNQEVQQTMSWTTDTKISFLAPEVGFDAIDDMSEALSQLRLMDDQDGAMSLV
ncbi:hypothetical protein M231_02354 [Tremella mesenterica]|uniref:Uncharacterized protein n=1 Tax=Tremella mesenterica TaxID=5217 RepID=A0A4Q1BQZ2_TREME|nr:uncharacterized protein TREMEDRAFT_64478 [Tremella mesenterica DSM 1558]EIW67230.1 hypothetical protein TREMEDRAFT_64478 [Tremella mesenterica DSM 1558]RXK40371.1 hypothetical protein M231_02354 [Tremella mesenterica]